MPNINSYPTISSLSSNDLLIVSDTSRKNSTKSVKIQALADYIGSGGGGSAGPAGAPGTNGTNGTNGVDGNSAYQIWLNAGNTGTEQEFLDSLVGEQGPAGDPGGVSSIVAGSNVTIGPVSGVGDVTVSSPDAIVNTEDNFDSTPKITNIVSLTEAEYGDLSVKENDTLYILI